MIFTAIINIDTEAKDIAERNKLEQWNNAQRIKYESSDIAKFTGIYINIKENRIQIKCSLHKYYNNKIFERLENDNMFTITEARRAIYSLFEEIGISAGRAVITNFEIGLNIPTNNEPIQYIELVQSINTGKAVKIEKELFNDANYKKHRQKTTEKHKNIKKIFKVYDKGFEKADRKRTPPDTDEKILRIETAYKRQYIKIEDFLSTDNISRLTATFYRDWNSVEFTRHVTADKGTRTGEIINAKNIILLGRAAYLKQSKTELENGLISPKQYRTIREFIRDWDGNKHKYRMLLTEHETEYSDKLKSLFKIASN